MRRWSLCSVFLLVFLTIPVLAQQVAIPNKPQLSVTIEPRHVKTGGAYVQGQIRLRVQLVSPHPFTKLELNLPPIEGARVLTLNPPQTRKIFNYGQEGFVYETRLALFPEQSGELQIPVISVSGAVAAGEGSDQSVDFSEINDQISLTIKPIDDAYDAQWWLVADEVSMTGTWSKPVETFRLGDIVRREIVVTVNGATAQHLPEIIQRTNAGYSVVGSESTSKTELSPEGVVAILRQTWDLRIEIQDVIYISPVRLDYWDPAAGAMAVASLPAQRIEPLPRDVAAMQAQLMGAALSAHQSRRIGLFVALSMPLLILFALLAAIFYQCLPTRADRYLLRSCSPEATPAACYRAVSLWSRTSFGADERMLIGYTQDLFSHEAAVRQHLDALQSALFAASHVTVDSRRLARSLTRAARNRRLYRLKQKIMNNLQLLIGFRLTLRPPPKMTGN